MSDPIAESNAYIKKHKLTDLFHNLGRTLVYEKNPNPNEALLASLRALQSSKSGKSEKTNFFNDQELSTMFKMFDLTNSGYINKTQYEKASLAIGIPKLTVAVESSELGINWEGFLKGLNRELEKI